MTTLTQQFKNITVLITNNQENEDAIVELAGMVPALRPLVEAVIDMDAPLSRQLHALSKVSDAVTFLRNNLDMFAPVTLPGDAPESFKAEMTLVRNDATGDLLLTIPVSGVSQDRDFMLYSVLPNIVDALFDKNVPTQTFYEFWPRL